MLKLVKLALPYVMLFFISVNLVAQQKAKVAATNRPAKKGKLVVSKFLAPSLEGNTAGNDPMRKITVYLPPGYEESNQKYPVIYFLHGGIEASPDSIFLVWWKMADLVDDAIRQGLIRPVIVVWPNSEITHGPGFCFYTNSTLTGNWSDYIAKDVVGYIDKNYRTITDRNSRGLCGHSGGGHGTIKIGMLHPDIFGSLYALNPAVLAWNGDLSLNSRAFKAVNSFRNEYSLKEIFSDLIQRNDYTKFATVVIASMARAYTPETNGNTFLSARLPARFVGDSIIIDDEILKKWELNIPLNMIDTHLDALKSFNGIKLDWGRDEVDIPAASLLFSKKLQSKKIKHFAEEYIGDHVNNIGGKEGRFYTELLPFFDTYLNFQESKYPSSK